MKSISAENCDLQFGQKIVLQQFSLQLSRGETVGLVGASGSGKSTAIRLIAGLERPTGGCVSWGGDDVFAMSKAEQRHHRRHIQLMFQDSAGALSPRRRILQSIEEPLVAHGIGTVGERRERVRDWLERVGLRGEMLERYPHQLSGGERQRVALARALILEPSFLLADEPVSALDPITKVQIVKLLQEQQRAHGFGLVLASHDPGVVARLTERSIQMTMAAQS